MKQQHNQEAKQHLSPRRPTKMVLSELTPTSEDGLWQFVGQFSTPCYIREEVLERCLETLPPRLIGEQANPDISRRVARHTEVPLDKATHVITNIQRVKHDNGAMTITGDVQLVAGRSSPVTLDAIIQRAEHHMPIRAAGEARIREEDGHPYKMVESIITWDLTFIPRKRS